MQVIKDPFFQYINQKKNYKSNHSFFWKCANRVTGVPSQNKKKRAHIVSFFFYYLYFVPLCSVVEFFSTSLTKRLITRSVRTRLPTGWSPCRFLRSINSEKSTEWMGIVTKTCLEMMRIEFWYLHGKVSFFGICPSRCSMTLFLVLRHRILIVWGRRPVSIVHNSGFSSEIENVS